MNLTSAGWRHSRKAERRRKEASHRRLTTAVGLTLSWTPLYSTGDSLSLFGLRIGEERDPQSGSLLHCFNAI